MERTLSIKLSPEELHGLLVSACKEAVGQLLPDLINSRDAKVLTTPEVYSTKKVCELLGITPPTLIKYRREGKITGKKHTGKYFYTAKNIQDFLNKK